MSYTSPQWSTSALITIDTQNDFTLPGAPAEIAGTSEVLPNMKCILDAYRTKGLPIIHVIRLYKEDGSNVDICRREALENGARIAIPDTEGAQLVHEIRPIRYTSLDTNKLLQGDFQPLGASESVLYKSRWGAFYNTQLEQLLRSQGVNTIVFTGCNFPNCPRASIYEASERDFRVVMVADAMSQVYEKGIQEIISIGVHVCSSDELLEALDSV